MLPLITAMVGLVSVGIAAALRRRRGHGISILIPFRCPDKTNPRVRNVEWLQRYWRAQLPGAEIIFGDDPEMSKPFSKSVAINNAVAKSKGDVLVIVDADGYIPAESVLHCATEIRQARKRGKKLWFVPYRYFYRLTEAASLMVLNSNPAKPHQFTLPLDAEYILGDSDPTTGHWYGAMIHIESREAFDLVGGWDERFRGWGGEDHAAMRALDTLYGLHKTLPGAVLHIWHPMFGPQGVDTWVHWKDRMWEGQTDNKSNNQLSWRYYHAMDKPQLMRKLVDESRAGVHVNCKDDKPHCKSV
jgi:glycosyltransferase involved in cell wall biosynthesis